MAAFSIHFQKHGPKQMAGRAARTPQGLRSIGAHGSRGEGYESVSNPDIDPTRTHLNRAVVPFPPGLGLDEAVEDTIKKNYRGKRAVRADAVKCTEWVITAPDELVKNGKADDYLDKAVLWLQTGRPPGSVVGAFVHKDEKSWHVHAYVVPLTPEGGLSAKYWTGGDVGKDLKGGRQKLQELRNNFYLNVAEGFGLERGEVYDLGLKPPGWEDEKKKHKPVREYKKEMEFAKELSAVDTADFVRRMREKAKKKRLFSDEVSVDAEHLEVLIDGFEINAEAINELRSEFDSENKHLSRRVGELTDENHKLTENVSVLQREVAGLKKINAQAQREADSKLRAENDELRKENTKKKYEITDLKKQTLTSQEIYWFNNLKESNPKLIKEIELYQKYGGLDLKWKVDRALNREASKGFSR